jgi:hypothetical protein
MTGAAGLVLGAMGALDVGPFARFPHEWQVVVLMFLFGAALLVQDSSRRDEIMKLSERRASVRASHFGNPPLSVTNIGQLEAQLVTAEPLEVGDYPWRIVFGEVGSLFKNEDRIPAVVQRRKDLSCARCPDLHGAAFNAVFHDAMNHRAHSLEAKPEVPAAEESRSLLRKTMGLSNVMRFPVRIRYLDSLGRTTIAVHRVEVAATADQLLGIRVVFECEEVHTA